MLMIWPSGLPSLTPWKSAAHSVQKALDHLEEWSLKWRLPVNPLNVNGCFFSTDPYQASHQPQLTLTGTPLTFNLTPKFLDVNFDRTFSFGSHVQSLRTKFFSRFKALRFIASATWCPFKKSLSQLYKASIRPVLSYVFPEWYPFLCDTPKKELEVHHRSACRVISGCLVSTPAPLLLLESLSSLEITLNHQVLAFYERALRLPADNFPPTTACLLPSETQIKEEILLAILLLITG